MKIRSITTLICFSASLILGGTSHAQPAAGAAGDAKAASPTLTDLWNGKAKWVPDADRIGGAFGFHFPSIIPVGDELWGYYICGYTQTDGRSKMAIGLARGKDGINWTDDGMVLDVGRLEDAKNAKTSAWDDRLTGFPGAWKDGDTWYMVYEGAGEIFASAPGDVGLATSKDGKSFVKHPNNPILRHETTGWENINIGTPSLYKEDGIWYLFYHGYDGNVCQIGVASGKDLAALTKCAANPLIPVTPGAAAWDTGTTGRRSRIVKEGDYYYMAFEGSTLPPFTQSKWSSGIARTKNLTGPWEKFPGNPMIPQTPGGMNNDGPELVKIGDAWFLYVRHAEEGRGNQSQRYRLQVSPESPKL